METKLSDLPKDLLVQLVATIREDVMKEFYNQREEIQNLEKILREILSISGLIVERCSHKHCSKFWVRNRERGHNQYKKEYFLSCKKCWRNFCDEHLDDLGLNLLCEECDD